MFRLLSPSPKISNTIPTSTAAPPQSSWVRPNLPSWPRRFRRSMPSRNGSELDQSTYRKSQRGSSSRAAQSVGPLERVGWVYVRVWVATGAWHHSPARWPLQMTLVSRPLKILVSTVTLQASLNTQSARTSASSVIG